MFGLDAGALEQKGQLLEAFLEAMGSKARKWLSRRDVPTSRRRRDVGTGSAHHHLKHEWFRIRGIGRRTNEGTEFQSRVTQTSKKCPGFVLFLIFVGY